MAFLMLATLLPTAPALAAAGKARKVKITFNPARGVFQKAKKAKKTPKKSTKKVAVGKKIGKTPRVTRAGYVFTGWYTTKGKKVNAKTKVQKKITVFARWRIKIAPKPPTSVIIPTPLPTIAPIETPPFFVVTATPRPTPTPTPRVITPTPFSPAPTLDPRERLNDNIIDRGTIESLEGGGLIETRYDERGNLRMIDGNFTNDTVSSAAEAAALLHKSAPLFPGASCAPADISVTAIADGESDEITFRFTPHVGSVPVLGNQIILSTDANGVVKSLFSTYDSTIANVSTYTDINEAEAVESALRSLCAEEEVLGFLQLLAPYDEESDENPAFDEAIAAFLRTIETDVHKVIFQSDGKAYLAYAVTVQNAEQGSADTETETETDGLIVEEEGEALPNVDETIYIAANDAIVREGTVLDSVSNVLDATEVAHGRTIETKDDKLVDDDRGIKTYNIRKQWMGWRNAFTHNMSEWWQYIFPGDLVEKGLFGWDAKAVNAHANFEQAYDYYKDTFNRDSFGNAHNAINVTLNAPHKGQVAYWNRAQFGIEKNYKAEYALDVIGHEYTHAVIQYIVGDGDQKTQSLGSLPNNNSTTQQRRLNEAGALNEAYSDILGMFAEGKQGADKWKTGEDLNVSIRDMRNERVYDPNKTYEVHEGLQIFTHTVYLMMTDDRTSNITDNKWAHVFYQSLFDLASDSLFLDARAAVICRAKAAAFTVDQIKAIRDAFDAVNITPSQAVRIVLRWGSSPKDLDSHLVGPALDGNTFHTWYHNADYTANGNLLANLDYDDIDCYGPEVTTIYTLTPGVYHFYVFDYSNRDSSSSTALTHSGATVVLYSGTANDEEFYRFEAKPSAGGATNWHVFDLTVSETVALTVREIDTYDYNPPYESEY